MIRWLIVILIGVAVALESWIVAGVAGMLTVLCFYSIFKEIIHKEKLYKVTKKP